MKISNLGNGLHNASFDGDMDNDRFLVEEHLATAGQKSGVTPYLKVNFWSDGNPRFSLSQAEAAELWPVIQRFAEIGTIADEIK